MILYEFEGKKLLKEAGIKVPKSQILNQAFKAVSLSTLSSRPKGPQAESVQDDISLKPPLVLKAQVLSGKRAKAGGIIKIQNSKFKIQNYLQKLLGKIINKEKVERILIEEMVEFDKEYYLSISYDTDVRGPVLTISKKGGTGVEERETQSINIDPINKSIDYTQIKDFGLPEELLNKLIKLFFKQDLLLLEINPLVKISGSPSTTLRTNSSEGIWIALDAKIKLDDQALARHKEWSASWRTPRSAPGHTPTKNEIEAKKIDQGDYRGVAGSTYFDLEGDIAVLSSGGGVSLTAMDALIKLGGKPANYTEYSGNPPKEKVVKLTKIVLGKENIHGLWVIGTVAANFTDIYETLSGIIEGLRQAEKQLGKKFDFPIVVRRGGPREKEAFEMLREVKDFNLTLQGEETSIYQSAKIMVEKAKKYASK